MYSVELFFEDNINEYVKKVWKELSEKQISSDMVEIAGIKPHITVALYEDIQDVKPYMLKLNEFMENQKKMTIHFDVIGTFPTSGTCFLSPTMTYELMAFHRAYHEAFKEYHEASSPYYIPYNWNPHCTLAVNLSPDGLVRAVKHAITDFKPIETTIEKLGLVRSSFKGDHCIRSAAIQEYDLI